jgi:hypothetical protein
MLFRDLDRIDNDGEQRGVEIPLVFWGGSLRCPKCNENGRKPKRLVSLGEVVQESRMNLMMAVALRAKHGVWGGPERIHILQT